MKINYREKTKRIFQLLRPKHSIKNILVLFSTFFSIQMFDIHILFRSMMGIVIFSLLSSAVYVINDIFDIENDRRHEMKKDRPLASGSVSIIEAYIVIVILCVCIIIIGLGIHQDISSWVILGTYISLNILYSKKLKHIPLVDTFSIMFFYIMRIMYGGSLSGIGVSYWLYMTVMSISLFMGFGKRRNDLKVESENRRIGEGRPVLKYYSISFLDKNMYVAMGMSILFYSLWCNVDSTIERIGNDKLMWTVPIVVFLLMRYSLDIENEKYADPVDVIFGDKLMIVFAILYAILMSFILYGARIL